MLEFIFALTIGFAIGYGAGLSRSKPRDIRDWATGRVVTLEEHRARLRD